MFGMYYIQYVKTHTFPTFSFGKSPIRLFSRCGFHQDSLIQLLANFESNRIIIKKVRILSVPCSVCTIIHTSCQNTHLWYFLSEKKSLSGCFLMWSPSG